MEKQFIKNLTSEQLIDFFSKQKEQKFRAKQLSIAIYNNRVKSFYEITNFSNKLQELLEKHFIINSLSIEKELLSVADSSIKFSLKTVDNNFIESVFLPNTDNNNNREIRNTLCISTMIGCPLNCIFCATGRYGFVRNLSTTEIADQYFTVINYLNDNSAKETNHYTMYKKSNHIDNIVFMGMGEPLLNYNNVVSAINIFTENKLIKRRSITISTAGIPDKIIELANIEYPVKLALSLHSPFDNIRQKLMPISKNYELEYLLKALDYYYHATRLPITFEYIVFDGLNNRKEDIAKLARITRRLPSKINLIPFNNIGFNIDFNPANNEIIEKFAKELYDNDIIAITRKSQGSDITGSCGQLANKMS